MTSPRSNQEATRAPSPTLEVAGPLAPRRSKLSGRSPSDRIQLVLKRGVDLVCATVMIVCLLPIFIVVAIAIRLDSPGPVLFRQRRIGRDRREFTMLKFRSMRADATADRHRRYIMAVGSSASDTVNPALRKLTEDPRVTRVGAILRKTSIDEAPQLFNVLVGQMSIVGPRPAVPYELELYRPEHFERFGVRPGITGLWQVSGRSRLDFYEMLDLDVEYVHRQGLGRDAMLILRTPGAIVRGDTA